MRLLQNHKTKLSYEQQHDKTDKMTCAPSKDLDQPGHLPSLTTESSLYALWIAKHQSLLPAESEDSDQTGQMPRLI